MQRRYADFDAFWAIAQTGPRLAPALAAMAPADLALLRHRLRARLPADADGGVTIRAIANAVKGRRPLA